MVISFQDLSSVKKVWSVLCFLMRRNFEDTRLIIKRPVNALPMKTSKWLCSNAGLFCIIAIRYVEGYSDQAAGENVLTGVFQKYFFPVLTGMLEAGWQRPVRSGYRDNNNC